VKTKKTLVFASILALVASGASDLASATTIPSREFDGVEVNIVTFTGPQIAEPLQRRAPAFAELTGANIRIITVPFADLFQSILTDQVTGTNSFDAFVFAPQWMVDYISAGVLEDITDRVNNDADLEWDDVGQFFREFSATFEGNVYTIPLDGDFHMVYYRTDVLEELGMDPPQTWDDYLAIAEAANGMDMNDDGSGDFGSCISKLRSAQSYWWITSIAAPFIQTQGTSQGTFFDLETFEPLVNNPGYIRALEIYKATNDFGPPNEQTLNVGDTRGLWQAGRCALTLDWGDIGTLAIDPANSIERVQTGTGAIITPGSTEVLDRETNELVPCDETTCPFAIDGVNHAPFASFGGWSGGVSAAASDEVKDAAYAFLSYMSQPAQSNEDVTIGRSGFNPYRVSQFENVEPWIDAGFTEEGAANYLGAIQESLNSPNMALDLRIPQNARYEQVILDTVLSQFLAGEFTPEEAAQQIFDQWEEVTNELGREDQLAAYLGTLGTISGGD
jgi:multiple sugar transport system substrate-binding protein